jgi:hypothetical protein
VNWVFGTLAITLGVVFAWGLFAPRSQWRTLSGWSVSDPRLHEPGGATYGILRLISGLGIVGVLTVAAVVASSTVANLPTPPPPRTAIEIMWGAPDPQVVNRYFVPLTSPPEGLVEMPLLGYQAFDGTVPDYLVELENFTYLGDSAVAGYLGGPPDEGFAAIDFASMVVHVRGPVLCIPRELVVIESEVTIQIAVYYGLPDPVDVDAPAPDNAAGCLVDDPVTGSLLIPIALANPVGDRTVVQLDGTEVERIRLSE